jgi:hypothetical protein
MTLTNTCFLKQEKIEMKNERKINVEKGAKEAEFKPLWLFILKSY